MDGLYKLVGTGATIEFGGELLTVQGRTLRHYGELEGHFLRLRGNPLDRVRFTGRQLQHTGDFAVDLCAELLEKTRFEFARGTLAELFLWRQTFEGHIFAIWQAIRHNNPALWTHRYTSQAFWRDAERVADHDEFDGVAAWCDGLMKAIDQASGEDELSLLDWIHSQRRDDSGESKCWAELVRSLVDYHHCTIDDVLDLTFTQFQTLVAEKSKLADDRDSETAVPESMKKWRRRFRNNYNLAAENLVQGNRWDSGYTPALM